MVNDLLNKPVELTICKNTMKLEYNHLAYAELENRIGKNIFYIYDALIVNDTLKIDDMIEVMCCGLMKHHTEKEIEDARNAFKADVSLLMQNRPAIVSAYLNPLMPSKISTVKKTGKKKPRTK